MIVRVKGLTRRFAGGSLGLDGLSLELDSAAFTVISGHNGSGKSLLLRHLLGLEQAQAGSILLDDTPLQNCLSAARRRIGLVFQEPEHQILGVTVAEDLAFGPRSSGAKAAAWTAAVDKALADSGLQGMANRLTSSLSGGEKRRLAVASCLVNQPELLLLDEPFNDLDWQGASDLLSVLLALRVRGIGVVVVTHDLEKCLAHADRLLVLDKGRLVADGTPSALWADLPTLGLRRLPGGPEQLAAMTWLKQANGGS